MPHVELPQAEFKVVMLGDTFAGKTSLVLRFTEGYYRDAGRSATVGANFITKRLTVHGVTCKIQIWDTAGQEQFKKIAPMYYRSAAAAIVCYDCTSPPSFQTLKYWIHELQQNASCDDLVIAMCATKCDLVDADMIDVRAAEELADKIGAMFLKTSAKQNHNVSCLFERIAQRVLLHQQRNDGLQLPSTFTAQSNDGQVQRRRQGGSYAEGHQDGQSLGLASTDRNSNRHHSQIHQRSPKSRAGMNGSPSSPSGTNGQSPPNSSDQPNPPPFSSPAEVGVDTAGMATTGMMQAGGSPGMKSMMNGDGAKAAIDCGDDDDDITEGPKFAESTDSADVQKTCDGSMLMCGDILGPQDLTSPNRPSMCNIQ